MFNLVPNITLLFQIINFIFVIFVLKKFVFVSVLVSINKERDDQASLLKSLKESEEYLLMVQKESRSKLLNFQKRMSEKYTPTIDRFLKSSKDISYKRNSEEVRKLINEFRMVLVREVSRVR